MPYLFSGGTTVSCQQQLKSDLGPAGFSLRTKYKGHHNRNTQIRATFSQDGIFRENFVVYQQTFTSDLTLQASI